jgi:hypothetical protein
MIQSGSGATTVGVVLALMCLSCSSSTKNEGGGGSGTADIACASGTNDQVYSPSMVGCDGARTQCDAQQLCGPGWHLCTYPEYLSQGGVITVPTKPRWIAACVVEYGALAPMCPSVAVCEQCSSTNKTPETLTWDCSGAERDQVGGEALGLTSATDSIPRRPGCAEAECSYVRVEPGYLAEFGAMCCLGPP